MPPALYTVPGVRVVNGAEVGAGLPGTVDTLVMPGPFPPVDALAKLGFSLARTLPGEPAPQRVVRNPLIRIFVREKKGE